MNNEAISYLKEIAVVSIGLLGAAFSSEDLDQAIACLDFSLSLDPANWVMYSNKAHCYNRNSSFDKAAEAIEKAIIYSGEKSADVYYNAGIIYSALKDTGKSISMYKKAMALNPGSATYRFYYACELLRYGNFEEGWKFYESRMQAFPEVLKIKSRFNVPDWDGKPVERLFIYNEQGIGDFFQFMRYLPLVKERCNCVILEVQKEVGSLTDYLPVNQVIYRTNEFHPIPKVDAVCSISSFPFIFRNVEVPVKPYIEVEKKVLEGINIGISWAGNPRHPHDIHRSFPLNLFYNIAALPVVLWNLQKDTVEKRVWNGKEVVLSDDSVKLRDFPNHDFKDCAVKIASLDLVITCDTAVAHLSAAMGKPTWLILGYISDFRWMGMEFESSFWYPTMKIFRRKKDESWQKVFERIESELKSLIA